MKREVRLIVARIDETRSTWLDFNIYDIHEWLRCSIVVEAAVHGCILFDTKGSVMRGIKERRKEKKRATRKRGEDGTRRESERNGRHREKMQRVQVQLQRCSLDGAPEMRLSVCHALSPGFNGSKGSFHFDLAWKKFNDKTKLLSFRLH